MYSGHNVSSQAGGHIHEGSATLMPGEESVIQRAFVVARMKTVEIVAQTDALLPGFNQEDVTVNGQATKGFAESVAVALKSGDVKIKNVGKKKALVALRLSVTAAETAAEANTPAPERLQTAE